MVRTGSAFGERTHRDDVLVVKVNTLLPSVAECTCVSFQTSSLRCYRPTCPLQAVVSLGAQSNLGRLL